MVVQVDKFYIDLYWQGGKEYIFDISIPYTICIVMQCAEVSLEELKPNLYTKKCRHLKAAITVSINYSASSLFSMKLN